MMKGLTKFSVLFITLTCIAVFLSACVYSLGSLARLAMDSMPAPNTSLLPADHGIPDTIAGYRVLAVRTSDTTLCMPPGVVEIILQVEATTVEGAMMTDVRAVVRELEHLYPDRGIRWRPAVIGPGPTFEGIVASNARLNAFFAENGCLERFGPIPEPLSS